MYQEKRSMFWQKIKRIKTQDKVIAYIDQGIFTNDINKAITIL